jgi:SIT4 phosphatase-associated protein
MLRVFASRIKDFQNLLAKPKSVPSSIATTFGHIEPLGFERFRICELYAELLHCSNMALLNDPRGEDVVRERDTVRERLRKEGRSKPPVVDIWGDTALRTDRQWRNKTYSSDGSEEGDEKDEVAAKTRGSQTSQGDVQVEDARSQQVISDVNNANHLEAESDATTAENVDKEKGELGVKEMDTGKDAAEANTEKGGLPDTTLNGDQNTDRGNLMENSPSLTTNTSTGRPVVGDYLKMQFVESRVLPSVVDLFFAHPWNNFLHNVVYDILTQVLNGPMDKGFNRQLAIDLFTTGQLTEKILHGQKASDEAQ